MQIKMSKDGGFLGFYCNSLSKLQSCNFQLVIHIYIVLQALIINVNFKIASGKACHRMANNKQFCLCTYNMSTFVLQHKKTQLTVNIAKNHCYRFILTSKIKLKKRIEKKKDTDGDELKISSSSSSSSSSTSSSSIGVGAEEEAAPRPAFARGTAFLPDL
ncbi:hypothetical protein T07_3567 [Trichinella nelsoni]|uniref:Uncharacterized protein n=1 Tax=Trichinella nelsoni TaxID=6336 RepID=A0A0V0RYW9_9BILA|nr:hypothetical protein T07_3567 [Trichinella nelsoni]